MTNQQMFDFVGVHLLRQNRKSVNSIGDCVYKACDSENTELRCAAGCLIPNNEYSPDFEGLGVPVSEPDKSYTRCPQQVKLKKVFTDQGCNLSLLAQLQTVHDQFDVHLWYERLLLLATSWRLCTKAIVGFTPTQK